MWYVAGFSDGYHGEGYFDTSYDGLFRGVILKSLDGTKEFSMKINDLLDSPYYDDGVIGLDYDRDYASVLVAPHSGKAAKLYSYIDEVKRYSGLTPPPYISSDALVCVLDASLDYKIDVTRSDQLLISSNQADIRFFGSDCSVITMRTRTGQSGRIYTMYDLLRILSNRLGCFVPAFSEIHVFSENSGMTTSLKFDRSAEAKSYFSKMAVEISAR